MKNKICENCGRTKDVEVDVEGYRVCKCGYVHGSIHDHETPAEKEQKLEVR